VAIGAHVLGIGGKARDSGFYAKGLKIGRVIF